MATMNVYARFKTDAALENEGAWIDYGAGMKFKMRRFSSKKVIDFKNAVEKPYRAKGVNDIPDEIAEVLAREIIAGAILIGWEGVFGTDEQPIEFSKDNALKLLVDLPDLAKMLLADSLNADNFKNKEKKEIAGN